MISIIVPIYNVERYLSKCIESLINQTYRDIEIILVDDGSPDNSGEICDNYSIKDSRIVVVHQTNKGVSAARNVGLSIAKGEYIGFVDPDDWVEADMYESLIKKMRSGKSDLAICGHYKINENGDFKEFPLDNQVYSASECIEKLFALDGFSIRPTVWNKLFIKEKIGDLKFDETLHISEDMSFLIQYILKIETVGMVKQPKYYNLVREKSVTRGGTRLLNMSGKRCASMNLYIA